MTEPVIRKSNDPVYVRQKVEFIELRIGDKEPANTRHVLLTPSEARLIGHGLLADAERIAGDRD